MASIEPWFSRRRTPGDLETKVFNSGARCKFLDENGEDVRFKQPGFRWDVFKERRKAIYKDYSERIQASFDQVYEKITGVRREKSQSPIAVLPTIKTPAISKSRSRVASKLHSQDLSPVREAPVISQPKIDPPLLNTENPVEEKVAETVKNLEPAILDVTNTTVRRSMRINKKDIHRISKPDDHFGQENLNPSKRPPIASHQPQADIALKEVPQEEVQPTLITASARPKRNTRSRTAKATSATTTTNSDTIAEPFRRPTRATSRRAAAKAAAKSIEESFSEEAVRDDTCKPSVKEVPATLVVEESDSGLMKGGLDARKNQKTRESVSLQQVKMSVCKVSMEKVVSPVTSPISSMVTPPEEGDEREQELTTKTHQQPMEEEKETNEANLSNETTQSTTTLSTETGDAGSDADGEEDGGMSIAAPPPKRSLSMKLKKKGKGRGGRKGGAGRGRKAAATRKVTPIPALVEEKEDYIKETVLPDLIVEPMEENDNSAPSHLPLLPTSTSSESVYESCASQLDSQQSPIPTAPGSPLIATDVAPLKSPVITPSENHEVSPDSPLFISESTGNDKVSPDIQTRASATVVKKPGSKIPVLRLVKSPPPTRHLQSTKPSTSAHTPSLATEAPPLATTHVKSQLEEREKIGGGGTYVKNRKRPLDGTHVKGTPSSLISRNSPSGPMNATYRVSPVSVPYLSQGHTPKTILQLQEKLRSQTKGKLVTLAELRNASPLFKKLTANKKKVATPSTVVKDGPSMALSPSKIPRLSPSPTPSSALGLKRLRSVSLERLSSDHMTKTKRRSPKISSGGSSSDEAVVTDEGKSPLLSRTPIASGGATCSSGSDYEVTPVPLTMEEGSSQDNDDVMDVSTTSSLDELPASPTTALEVEGTALNEKSNAASKDFIMTFFSKKNNFTREDIAKKAPAVTSLIPARNSPRKIETREARQEKLFEKVQRKREEEERRREELKSKKLQEIEEKRRKREAKAKKVAENQAALKEQEIEKKKKLKGQSKDDPVKKVNQKRAREVKERQRKHREKAQAAETKRKEEEEAAKKRAQQLEEDWRIVTELATKRKEIEEEEKRQKRLDKQKEREQKKKQRELEEEKKQAALAIAESTTTTILNQKPATTTTNVARIGGPAGKDGRGSGNIVLKKIAVNDPKKRMEELLTGTISKVKAPTPVVSRGGASGCGSSGEEMTAACPGSGEKSNGFMKQWYGLVKNSATKSSSSTAKTKKKTPAIPANNTTSLGGSKAQPLEDGNTDNTSQSSGEDEHTPGPPEGTTSDLNSTFTKEKDPSISEDIEDNSTTTSATTVASSCTPTHNNHFHLMAGSALATSLATKGGAATAANGPQSYAMTPADSDPLFAYENYDIGNLSSDDSTDDEECPKKVIPPWADSRTLVNFMLDQEAALEANCIDVNKIFPPEQLLKDIDLARIFKFKRKRFFQRSSSAHWNSPLYKKNRFEI